MNSIVLELQRDALNPSISVLILLRKLMLTMKLLQVSSVVSLVRSKQVVKQQLTSLS
ncbi:hypothetical protein [Nostoc sp. CALU 546]|uniref:hypothetical protein n=1 Tax=Nostoc sp. CALU 546 TaxID=1867241 RepID=UPI003B66D84B